MRSAVIDTPQLNRKNRGVSPRLNSPGVQEFNRASGVKISRGKSGRWRGGAPVEHPKGTLFNWVKRSDDGKAEVGDQRTEV